MTDLTELSPQELKNLVDRGIIDVMTTQPIPTTIEETPEFQRHAALAGQPIHVSAAAREYDIPHPTISRWVKLGYIPVLGMDKNRKLLDWAYVAYCATVYKSRHGQGKWIFDEKGLPYIRKTR